MKTERLLDELDITRSFLYQLNVRNNCNYCFSSTDET